MQPANIQCHAILFITLFQPWVFLKPQTSLITFLGISFDILTQISTYVWSERRIHPFFIIFFPFWAIHERYAHMLYVLMLQNIWEQFVKINFEELKTGIPKIFILPNGQNNNLITVYSTGKFEWEQNSTDIYMHFRETKQNISILAVNHQIRVNLLF